MKAKVHRIETSIFPYIKVTCGIDPMHIYSHAGLGKWRGVTCKRCLAKKGKSK